MRSLPRIVPDGTAIPFFRYRYWAFVGSLVVMLLAIVMMVVRGFNLGIDFAGGILLEVRTPGPAPLAQMRATLGGLGLGDVALQEAGAEDLVMIRVVRQPGDESAQQAAVEKIKQAVEALLGAGVEWRRAEYVGPKVGEELRRAGTLAVVIALIGVLVYLWFRFEWQFGVAAIAACIHDVFAVLLVFSLSDLEFNLSSIAAILTVVGYSLNDTVVVFDRVRENLRRYKAMPIDQLIDKSINETLARTVMTTATTLLALLALYIFGGPVIRGFTFAMLFGILIGTYSTIYIAAPILYYLNLRPAAAAAAARETP